MQNLISNFETYLHGAPLLAYLVVFIAGILTSFTPCVYPVIPIIIGYIGGKQAQTRRRGFCLSFAYVLGMSLTFTILGAVAATTGKLFGEVQSSPIAHLVVGNVIILFGLSLFGVFNVPMPGFLKGQASPKKGYLGAFGMGFASGFVAAPCTSAVLGALLAYVATRQNVLFGMSLLFVFAMGIGCLLLFLGTFSTALLAPPKLKRFSEALEKAFGFLMLALGEYFLIKAGRLWG